MEWAADGTLKKHVIFPCQFHRILTLHTAGCVYSKSIMHSLHNVWNRHIVK